MKERSDVGTDIQGVVPDAPGLQGGSRHLELLGGLTLGDALGSQLPVLLKEVRTLESIPAWLAVRVALLRVLESMEMLGIRPRQAPLRLPCQDTIA